MAKSNMKLPTAMDPKGFSIQGPDHDGYYLLTFSDPDGEGAVHITEETAWRLVGFIERTAVSKPST